MVFHLNGGMNDSRFRSLRAWFGLASFRLVSYALVNLFQMIWPWNQVRIWFI
jgi:hypothetical protein